MKRWKMKYKGSKLLWVVYGMVEAKHNIFCDFFRIVHYNKCKVKNFFELSTPWQRWKNLHIFLEIFMNFFINDKSGKWNAKVQHCFEMLSCLWNNIGKTWLFWQFFFELLWYGRYKNLNAKSYFFFNFLLYGRGKM